MVISSMFSKKISVLFIVFGSFIIGYKGKSFINKKIYEPIRSLVVRPQVQPTISNYKSVECPINGISIATFGQSNSANTVAYHYQEQIPRNLFMYDWRSQQCYKYQEPLPGTNGTGGNVITYTGVKIASISDDPVIIIPFGVGQTSVLQWAYGDLSYQHKIAMERISKSRLSPTVFLWHQGEQDRNLELWTSDDLTNVEPFGRLDSYWVMGISEDGYYNALKLIVERTLESFPDAKFGIALASRCRGKEWEPVRKAQLKITKTTLKTFLSADSDQIYGNQYRSDSCHFSPEGARKLGSLYYESILKNSTKLGTNKVLDTIPAPNAINKARPS